MLVLEISLPDQKALCGLVRQDRTICQEEQVLVKVNKLVPHLKEEEFPKPLPRLCQFLAERAIGLAAKNHSRCKFRRLYRENDVSVILSNGIENALRGRIRKKPVPISLGTYNLEMDGLRWGISPYKSSSLPCSKLYDFLDLNSLDDLLEKGWDFNFSNQHFVLSIRVKVNNKKDVVVLVTVGCYTGLLSLNMSDYRQGLRDHLGL